MSDERKEPGSVGGVGLRPLVSQIEEMLRVFDWRTVYAVHCLTTASPHPLETLQGVAREILMAVATAEKPITVLSNKFAAFIDPTEGNLMLEYNLARVEGLSSLANADGQPRSEATLDGPSC